MSKDLKTLKLARTQVRRHFTKSYNELNKVIDEPNQNIKINSHFMELSDIVDRLFIKDDQIQTMILAEEDINEDEYSTECDSVQEYRGKWISIKAKYEAFREAHIATDKQSSNSSESVGFRCNRNFNLPKLNLNEFDGDVRNWISFWGQFKKVHNDSDLSAEDKFQYLIQATKPGSSARELVESFPPSGENYAKAIEQLKSRFARDEFLIEVYVRELLKLVMQQATINGNMPLSKLFDKLETQLRALETLGVTSEKYAAMLYPLVESALPEDTLRVWERERTSRRSVTVTSNQTLADNSINHLQELLNFLRAEVESEERLALARQSFIYCKDDCTVENNRHRKTHLKKHEPQLKLPTAATIVATENHKVVSNCLFCKKSGHSIQECSGFHKLNLSEKRDFILKKGACFSCLKLGHTTKNCKVFVNCCICHKKHHSVMCKGANQAKVNEYDEALVKSKSNSNEKGKSEVLISQSSETLLQTLLVKVVSHSNQEYLARVLLDTGSQRSYVTKDCVERLGLSEVGREVINHSLFGGVSMKRTTHKTYLMTLQNVSTSFQITVPVLDQDIICRNVPRLQDDECLSVLKRKGIIFTDVGENVPEIKVLLGADVIGELYTGKVETLRKSLVAMETYLGWTIMGQQHCNEVKQHSSLLNMFCSGKSEVPDLWSLDTIGIKDPVEVKTRSHMEAETIRHFKENVKVNDTGRYEVCLPWIEGHPKLLDNRDLAEKRLLSVTRRLYKLNKFNDYDEVFNNWLTDGIVEKVPETCKPTVGHYLPHQAVVKESSMTTKIRPVFDASAKDYNGVSLNSCLEKGPNLVELIPLLVMKFRQHQIGVISDIKKAFLQISLSTADRDYLKFLWWEDYEKKNVTTFRHCRVVFGVTSSPFLLGATISHHLDKAPPEMKETAERLRISFYVDNCVTSVDSVESLNRFVRESSIIMNTGQFELRGWCSNVPISETGFEDNCLGEPTVPLLGMLWDTQEDVLFCDIKSLSNTEERVTKRSILSIAQRLFDVVGFTSPVSLIPKLLLQKTWVQKLTWDEELPDEIASKFLNWWKEIKWLERCRIQRTFSYFIATTDDITIHVFCDASKYAYAACVFVRSKCGDKVDVQLLSASSRIAPLKQITIPRLELLAAVIGSRLYVQARKVLNLNSKVYFWTDSTTALTWIRVKENWNTFVGNRCKEICQSTEKDDWHHIPGDMNAADLPSRGCGAKFLYESKWWEGPAWLKEDESKWPVTSSEIDDKEAYLEKKKTVTSAVVTESYKFTDQLLYFSKYSKVVRMIAWLMRFIYNSSPSFTSTAGELSISEINAAEVKLIKCIQTECFRGKNNTLPKNLPVFIDENGLLRVKTRLTLSDDGENFKTPRLLPSNHQLVSSLVMEKHTLHQHAGVQTLLVILREQFWIIRGRKTVRNILSKCVICKRHKAKAGSTPFPPLPIERISDCNAFYTTGIDLAGPLYLRNGNKAWIVLFACSVYRAIHLELIESLSTDAFIDALRRFISRRGRPSIIFTDNGTNFVGTKNLLNMLNWKQIMLKFDVSKILWKFNPPSAPWWGGWWERLVRMVKELLRRNLGSASLNYEELMTLLCDCEATINSRPLTYVSDDLEILQPLTPSMFLQPTVKSNVCDLDMINSSCLNKRVRYVQKLREALRSRFRKEYLSMLVNRAKSKQLSASKINVGDVVLIGDDNTKRLNWPLALVVQMYEGKDGYARVARLRTANGELTRPIQRLYPLEVRAGEEVLVKIHSEKSTDTKEERSEKNVPADERNKKDTETESKTTRRGRCVKPPQRLDL